MNTHQSVKVDERTTAVTYEAGTLAFAFITVALIIDVMCRHFIYHDKAHDLVIILFVSWGISAGYKLRHKAVDEPLWWRVAIICLVTLIVLGVVGFIVALTKTS